LCADAGVPTVEARTNRLAGAGDGDLAGRRLRRRIDRLRDGRVVHRRALLGGMVADEALERRVSNVLSLVRTDETAVACVADLIERTVDVLAQLLLARELGGFAAEELRCVHHPFECAEGVALCAGEAGRVAEDVRLAQDLHRLVEAK